MSERRDGFGTLAIHGGQSPDPTTGAVMPPVYQTSTYVMDGLDQPRAGYEYSRAQNPTREALERNIASLEKASAGVAFASGIAATEAVLKLLEPGDHVISEANTYGGTPRLFDQGQIGRASCRERGCGTAGDGVISD